MKLRNWKGQFTSRFVLKLKIAAGIWALAGCAFVASAVYPEMNKTLVAVNVAEAAEVVFIKNTTVEQMKRDLVEIVWRGESGMHVPEEGEVLPTFDPSPAMYQKCIKIGGRHPKDCLSWGPMQIKIGTVQHYAPKIYGREVSEKEAREIAEDLERAKHFFLECSIKVQGCAWNWTAARNHKSEVETLIKYIRQAEGITL